MASSTNNISITPDNWFEKLLRFPETKFKYTYDEIPIKYHDCMGTFQPISIKDLKEQIDFTVVNNEKLPLTVYHRDTYYEHTELFDTSALQFNAKPNTLFQVASNFNCLENPKANYNVFNGYFITNQMTDITQGPSASGGAAFGAILRLIKHKEQPINLLSDVPIEQNNGKVEYRKNMSIPEFDSDLIRVGLHRDTRACFLRSDEFKYNPAGPKINQVFTSTCICDTTQPNKLSKVLLEAAYEATYLSAIFTKAPEVVLTMIGGGVFNNNNGLIIDAMMKAHNKYSPYLVKDCIVKLPIYVPTPEYILKCIKKYKNVKFVYV